MRKTLGLISVFIILVASLVGCHKSGTVNRQKQLRLAIPTEPPQLDPRRMRDTTSSAIARMFAEGLLRYDFHGEISPGLAQSYEVDDSQTRYTFTLRPNLKWSDGSALTAYDFEYSWKKLLDPNFLSEYSYLLFVIKNAQAVKEGTLSSDHLGVRALDELHLEVELNQPVSYFPEMVAFYTFFPVPKGIDNKNAHWAQHIGKDFLSCGPFHLVKWKHNSELRLIKNPYYWDSNNVHLDSINIAIVHDESTVLNMFENKDLDFIGFQFCTIPLDSMPQWREHGILQSRPVAFSLWYKLNTTLPVLRNEKIRRALSLAIDRQSIAKNVTQGVMLPATTFLPPSMQLNSNLIQEHAAIQEAQQLLMEGLQEEGLKQSAVPKLRLCFNDNELNRRIAQAIQQQWKDNLGLDIGLESLEWKVYLSKVHKMDYEIARLGWAADFNDPMNYLEVYKYADPIRGSNNATGWEDPNYTRLLDEAAAVRSKEEYRKLLAEAERLIVQACPTIPLFHYTVNWLQSAHLKDVSTTGLGRVDFKWARLESPSNQEV